MPVIPTTLSLNSLEQLYRHLRRMKQAPPVWPFFSMVDRRKTLHRELCEEAATMPYDFLDAPVPYSSLVERMGVRRAPLPAYAARSRATRAYRRLADAIAARL